MSQSPEKSHLTPAAYALLSRSGQAALLVEYLHDLSDRLEWVDEELTRHGLCAQRILLNGDAGRG